MGGGSGAYEGGGVERKEWGRWEEERETEREISQKGSSQSSIVGHEVRPLLNVGYLLSLFRVWGLRYN